MVVIEEVPVTIVLVCRRRRAVGAVVRRAVDDEVPGAVDFPTYNFLACPQALGTELIYKGCAGWTLERSAQI